MVCVDIDEDGYQGKVVNVVLATEHDDIALARDHRGHFLVYDEHMNLLADDSSETGTRAITIADYRDWPQPDDWEQGPDALRYPGLYDEPSEDDELEPFDLDDPEAAQTS